MFKLYISCFFMSVVGFPHAATFCVDNSNDLRFTLQIAASNNQDDVIKIEGGTYLSTAPSSSSHAFVYDHLDNDYSLVISGGWLSVFSNCDAQSNGNSLATVLDSENTVTPLFIKLVGTSANITIDKITFINGWADFNGRGGGLNIRTSEGYNGVISITRNQFIANQADYGSALSLACGNVISICGSGNRINVKNNLFVVNEALIGFTINIEQDDGAGVYFTNNTVINNTGDGFRVAVSGTSQAMVANNLFWNNDVIDVILAGDGASYLYHNNFDTIFNPPDFELGNFSEEPEFEGGFLDFTPTLSSSVINRGYMPFPFPFPPPFIRNWSLGTTDVLGKDRVQDNRVDIGAFEAPAEPPIFKDGFE